MNVVCAALVATLMGFQGVAVLERSHDREALEKAAIALASSGDADAVTRLGEFLRRPEFLARLDDLGRPSEKTFHLRRVFEALEAHPSGATARVCVMLAGDAAFLADDDRRIYLLPALAAVAPMSESAVAVFRRASEQGYDATVAPLLVKNGSPRALALFEVLIRDRNIPVDRRVDALHASILPRRTELAVLNTAGNLMASHLEEEVALGLIESLFDYQSKRWFGTDRFAPVPPPWEQASPAALRKVLALGAKANAGHRLTAQLAGAVKQTEDTVRRILALR